VPSAIGYLQAVVGQVLSHRYAATQLRTAVDIVIGMAQSMQEEISAGKLTMAEAENQLRTRCRHMMFD
jgi:hypothetical protein